MWPDLDDEQIKEMVDRKFEEEKRKLEMTVKSMQRHLRNQCKLKAILVMMRRKRKKKK